MPARIRGRHGSLGTSPSPEGTCRLSQRESAGEGKRTTPKSQRDARLPNTRAGIVGDTIPLQELQLFFFKVSFGVMRRLVRNVIQHAFRMDALTLNAP
jgi:hypothetical protein